MQLAISYESAKAIKNALEQRLRDVSAILEAFPKGALGMTPDAVKSTPEWQAAKGNADQAFSTLRAFNTAFCRQFKKEYAAERKANGR